MQSRRGCGEGLELSCLRQARRGGVAYWHTFHRGHRAGIRMHRISEWSAECKCIDGIMASTATRYVPVLFMDANEGFGYDPPFVGRCSTPGHGRTAFEMYPYLRSWDMALVNTHYDVGPTWHGPRGEEKVLDYVALPTSVIGEI